MICKDIFDAITNKASAYKYSAMTYLDFEDCNNSEILHDGDDFILMQDKSKTPAILHFAANDFEALVKAIACLPGKLRMNFVPKEYAPHLSKIGFTQWAEFVDFWNNDIAKTVSQLNNVHVPEYLSADDCGEAYAISKRCELQSRGYEGQSVEYFASWLEEHNVIIQRSGPAIAGYCCVSIYNEGTTLWVRDVGVDPKHQGKGLGKMLMQQALCYGVQNGAVKAFLAADILNENAIGLFNKYGFFAKEVESELQMVKR
ncbi:MAG: GNAT family N-acetyltransferase [Defluviitaleaceae bacterium]|nr:GNAT family N-acetyltransferase [Defluviitaleaceae bacterium]